MPTPAKVAPVSYSLASEEELDDPWFRPSMAPSSRALPVRPSGIAPRPANATPIVGDDEIEDAWFR